MARTEAKSRETAYTGDTAEERGKLLVEVLSVEAAEVDGEVAVEDRLSSRGKQDEGGMVTTERIFG